MWQSVKRVLTLLFMGRQHSLTQGECWARIGEQVELEVEEAQAPVVR